MEKDMVEVRPNGIAVNPLSAAEVRAQVNLIQEVMKGVMQEGQHYGIVPGCGNKPSLLKPGAEKLAMTFRMAPEIEAEDLSTADSIRYRVRVNLKGINTGLFVGSGVGEASTDEDKFKWRRSVCDAEFNETPEDRRREKWRSAKGSTYKEKQVRTNPADLANTVLKMAKKRALVDAVLTATAASDIFTQDIEDMDETVRSQVPEGVPANGNGGDRHYATISDKQGKRFWAIAKSAGRTEDEVKMLLEEHGFKSIKDITPDKYESLCELVGVKEETKTA